jgi:ABC-type branched-subunit amino acid transport system substrate-binding protein
VFSIVHTPEARAQALARHALETGARAFAILGPESPAALRQSDAFRVAVIAGGGQLVASSTYPPTASSFGAAVAPLKRAPVDAVFVPDDAEKLELVAPALAAADLWPRPLPPPATSAGAPAKDQRRPILLLSTALRPGPALLRNAGRYVQGALFAPGFIPEPEDPVVTAFVDRYRASFRQEPGASDAYGYDAVSLLSAAVTLGARTPEAVAAHLARAPFRGVTGPVRFGSDRRRSDPPAVFVVEGDALRRRR